MNELVRETMVLSVIPITFKRPYQSSVEFTSKPRYTIKKA